jgi:hypothetical protein
VVDLPRRLERRFHPLALRASGTQISNTRIDKRLGLLFFDFDLDRPLALLELDDLRHDLRLKVGDAHIRQLLLVILALDRVNDCLVIGCLRSFAG